MSPSIYESKSSSIAQKIVMQLASLGAFVVWFLYVGGDGVFARWLGRETAAVDPVRRALLVGCSTIYGARLILTQFHLVKREIGWKEASTIAIWVIVIHLTMLYLGGTNPARAGNATYVGALFYVVGSFLNSGSELLRDAWKRRPENKGKLYTGGLFRYSIHMNYFGDFVLFTGFALVTGSVYAFAIPLVMMLLFVFVNIPMLDEYLAKHYGDAFVQYARRTAKLVPFVY
ncbi:DUF1295 domain-containing protein [soil metagenome]